jgi:hypothetical protein
MPILLSVIFSGWKVHLILGANGKVLNVERREGGGRGRCRVRMGEGGGGRGGRWPVALYSDSLLHGSVLKVV